EFIVKIKCVCSHFTNFSKTSVTIVFYSQKDDATFDIQHIFLLKFAYGRSFRSL
ncbi:hypothetical protein M5D96_010793, partial [Drosophila gunungcola]